MFFPVLFYSVTNYLYHYTRKSILTIYVKYIQERFLGDLYVVYNIIFIVNLPHHVIILSIVLNWSPYDPYGDHAHRGQRFNLSCMKLYMNVLINPVSSENSSRHGVQIYTLCNLRARENMCFTFFTSINHIGRYSFSPLRNYIVTRE